MITERNQRILDARASGKSLREIAKEFGISAGRVEQIVYRYTRSYRIQLGKTMRDYGLNEDDLLDVRLYNALRYYFKDNGKELNRNSFKNLEIEEAKRIRNIGKKTLKRFIEAKESLKIR